MIDTMPLQRKLRLYTMLRQVPQLRETFYLFFELRSLLFYRPHEIVPEHTRIYEASEDPWGYATEWGGEHLRVLCETLDAVAGADGLWRGIDIGCGDGSVCAAAANRCRTLLGVDVVPIALTRARHRCRELPQVSFREWDLKTDPPFGRFNLILLMGVLECFSWERELRLARGKIVEMLEPEGILLVSTTRQSPAFDKAWWGRWLPRGGEQIGKLLTREPCLTLVRTVTTQTHHFSAYRKTHCPEHAPAAVREGH